MKTLLLPAIMFMMLLYACISKKEDIRYTTLQYQQTSCSDPWGSSQTDSITLKKVRTYFDSLQLFVAGLDIQLVNPIEICNACTCKTGKVIYITIFEAQRDRYLKYGFK